MKPEAKICAVILAAGRSRRMGQPKLLMPWGASTVIGQVVTVLREASITDIFVVTGAEQEKISAAIEAVNASNPVRVRIIPNPDYEQTEMLVSLQLGVGALETKFEAALVVLGDQPTISVEVIRTVVDAYRTGSAPLVIPSFRMRRGHPWLIKRDLWPALLAMPVDQTARGFLNAHQDAIQYVVIDAPEVLEDIDTPEDYRKLQNPKRPSHPKQR